MGIAAACLVITLVGLTDDLRSIRPKTKVLGQVAAAVVLLASGVGLRMVNVLITPFDLTLSLWIIMPLSALICVLLVIAACNATNLLDGLDGLCGGVTFIIALGFLALAAWLATWGKYPGVDELRVAICLAMAGGILGFLPYNIPPASIFMGDAGSMLLGFFVATMMALFSQEGPFRWVLAAGVVFALPILDTALAVVRRFRAGINIFAGDRSHLYDQLVDRGLSVKQVVVLFYVLAAAAAVLGVLVAISVRTLYAVILYAVLLLVIWTIFSVMGMVAPPPKRPQHEDRPSSSSGESDKVS
jgi:UDP-GlcNAc:undecaprenyl-phosphate GlcNAc-1-phosphate transferase